MDKLISTLLECIYIIYMMCFFKTKYSIAHPMSKFNNDLFHHPIGIKNEPKNMICLFGKIMSTIMSIFILVRYFFIKRNNKLNKLYKKYHKSMIYILLTLCLINFNALLYLLPIFIIELVYC